MKRKATDFTQSKKSLAQTQQSTQEFHSTQQLLDDQLEGTRFQKEFSLLAKSTACKDRGIYFSKCNVTISPDQNRNRRRFFKRHQIEDNQESIINQSSNSRYQNTLMGSSKLNQSLNSKTKMEKLKTLNSFSPRPKEILEDQIKNSITQSDSKLVSTALTFKINPLNREISGERYRNISEDQKRQSHSQNFRSSFQSTFYKSDAFPTSLTHLQGLSSQNILTSTDQNNNSFSRNQILTPYKNINQTLDQHSQSSLSKSQNKRFSQMHSNYMSLNMGSSNCNLPIKQHGYKNESLIIDKMKDSNKQLAGTSNSFLNQSTFKTINQHIRNSGQLTSDLGSLQINLIGLANNQDGRNLQQSQQRGKNATNKTLLMKTLRQSHFSISNCYSNQKIVERSLDKVNSQMFRNSGKDNLTQIQTVIEKRAQNNDSQASASSNKKQPDQVKTSTNKVNSKHMSGMYPSSVIRNKREQVEFKNSLLCWDKQAGVLKFIDQNPQTSKKAIVDALSKLRDQNSDSQLNISNLNQNQPKFEEFELGDIREYERKVFTTFEEECHQEINLEKMISYSGHLEKGQKSGGVGGQYDSQQKEFYFGPWLHDQRSGFGISFQYGKIKEGSPDKLTSYRKESNSHSQTMVVISVFKGNWIANKKQGLGIMKIANGDVIFGQFENDKLKENNQVQIKYGNGDVYVGPIKKGKREGKGLYHFNNGDEYEGTWDKDVKSGKGRLSFALGGELVGEFKNDEIVKGYFKDQTGNVFKADNHPDEEQEQLNGRFVKNKIFGYTKIEYKNKDRYEGMMRDGQRSGHGKMIYNLINPMFNSPEVSEYVGQWRFNLRHGQGTQKWADSSCFTGEWHSDKRHKGQMKLADGVIYEGSFKDDKFNGKGSLIFTDKNQFTGIFDSGKCPKFGMMSYKEGVIYLGFMIDFRRNGPGYGSFYEGEFVNDHATGIGYKIFPNGDYYTGYFQGGKREGAGRLQEKEQKRFFEGKFYQDKKEGEGYYFYEDPAKGVYSGTFKSDKEDGVGEFITEKELSQISRFQALVVNERIEQIELKVLHGMRELGVDIHKMRMERLLKVKKSQLQNSSNQSFQL